METEKTPVGGSGSAAHVDGQEVQRLKPNAIGMVGVIFMAVATAAPITAMTGNVPVAVGFGNGTGAPAGYLFATVVLTIFSVGYVAMARHITAAGAFYGYISHGLGQVVGMASGLLACLAYIVFEASIIGIFASFVQTGIAAVIIGLFWVSGQDPYLGLYVLMAILGTFAILVVQTLCSFAVIGYFRKNHPEARHWFRTFLAPLLGGIGMAVVVVLLLLNAGTAAGDASETLLFKLIPWIVVGVFLIGVALALYLRSSNPERYRMIGRIIYEDSAERQDADLDGRGDHAENPARH